MSKPVPSDEEVKAFYDEWLRGQSFNLRALASMSLDPGMAREVFLGGWRTLEKMSEAEDAKASD